MKVPQTKVQTMTRNSARSSSKSSEKDVAPPAAEAEAKAPEIESAFEKIDDVAAAEGGPPSTIKSPPLPSFCSSPALSTLTLSLFPFSSPPILLSPPPLDAPLLFLPLVQETFLARAPVLEVG